MGEHYPIHIYEHQRVLFDRVLAMPLHERLLQPVEVLPFAIRVFVFCIKYDIKTLGDLSSQRRKDLLQVRKLGKKTIEHMEAYLNEVELGFDGRRRWPAGVSEDYIKGTDAMRDLIAVRLLHLKIDSRVIQSIRRIPAPFPDERIT